MFFDALARPTAIAIVAILCLLPAAVRWWSGRSLLAALDDPLLPERLVAHRGRSLLILLPVLLGVLLVGRLGDLVWALPLLVVARAAAGFPLRRALYAERWSLAAYLFTMFRLLLAVAGFWVLLLGLPIVGGVVGSARWFVAPVLSVLLLLLNGRSAETFRWLMRSKPLPEGPLLVRLQAMAAASRTPRARFEMIDLGGGAIANALALASPRGSSVLYTDTILALLDPDETAAITAHEIAHLEHFDAARLGRQNRITTALILGATLVALLSPALTELSGLVLLTLWCAALTGTVGWMARDRQKNETASDLRGVELSGDAEALVRALIKVYTFARLPRRQDVETERMASHPSLARRIRAIRDAAGAAPESPGIPESETVAGLGGKTVITFERDRLQWHESEGVTHVLSYAHLTELRVYARAVRSTRLVAVERGGRRWEVALEAADAARAQAILDRVDARLAEPAAKSHVMPLLQVAVAGVAICAIVVGQVLVGVVALAASMRSAPAFFAAAGGAAIGAAAIAGRQMIATGDTGSVWPTAVLAVLGLALLAGAWRTRGDDDNRVVNAGVAALAVLVLLSLTVIVMRGGSAVGLNQASLALPSAAALPCALAAALAFRTRRGWRLAAIPIALVGLMVGIAGSGTFLHAFGNDPFLVNGRQLPIEPLTGSPFADVTLPGAVTDLRLSPGGRQVAVLRQVIPVGVVASFSVGTPGSPFESVAASDLVFLDDARLLTLGADGADTLLREVTLRPVTVVWERRIRNLQAPRLAWRRESRRWLVTGASFDGHLVSVDGEIGSAEQRRREWKSAGRSPWSDAWAVDGDTVLLAEQRFPFDPADAGALGWTMMAMLDHMRTRITRITPDAATELATSELDASCTDRVFEARRLVCTAFDGARSQVFVVDPADGTPRPIGSLTGRFVSYGPTRDGWLSGWVTSGSWNSFTRLAIDAASGRARSIPESLRADEFTVSGNVVGTLAHDASSTRVSLYRLDQR